MIKYSLIIPHKNCPKLLQRCLNSIRAREDLEIIIADDNSDDSIVDFKHFPGSEREDVILILNKESRGAGYARNIALERAQGKWLLFADADDYFSEEIHSILDKYSNDDKTDMVFLNSCFVDEDGKTKPCAINRYMENYFKKKKHSLDVLRYGFWTPWSRMVKRSVFIIHQILFEEVPVGNDMMGILLASKYSRTFAVEPVVTYYYYQASGGSLTDSYYNEETYYQRMENQLKLNHFYKEVGYPFPTPIIRNYWKGLYSSEKSRSLLAKWNYNPLSDFFMLFKYLYYKVTRTT